jgi:ribonuclease HI
MAKYIIRVDSSPKPAKNVPFRTKSGESSAAWTIDMNGTIIAAGLIRYHYKGPNKSIYGGILAALSQLEPEHFYAGGTDEVKICADCQPVINQLNGRWAPDSMKKHWSQVKEFFKRHPHITAEFVYENETIPEYKKVDQLAKVGRNWIKKMI